MLAREAGPLCDEPAGERASTPCVHHPQGHNAAFIIDVLAAWMSGGLACPLDAGQPAPPASAWAGLREKFPRTVLAKTTSGSTGAPRHVLFTAPQLMADADHIVPTMGLGAATPNIAAISLAHSYGFSNLVLPLLLHGIPLVIADSPLPQAVRQALALAAEIGASGQAALPGVPAMWRAWHAAGVVDAAAIRIALSAGAPLPLELERAVFASTGVKIHNFLGSSECGGIAYDRADTPRAEASLAGTPLDGVTLSLNDDGVLVAASPAVGTAYWPPEKNQDTSPLGGGRFCTGDLAEEINGAWHLRGRLADTLNLAGRKLHPAEVENVLRQHPAVEECLVFGVPSGDASRGEESAACLALRPGASADEAALRAWLGQRLPAWKIPRHWWFPSDFAANTRGKFSRAEWRARFLNPGL